MVATFAHADENLPRSPGSPYSQQMTPSLASLSKKACSALVATLARQLRGPLRVAPAHVDFFLFCVAAREDDSGTASVETELTNTLCLHGHCRKDAAGTARRLIQAFMQAVPAVQPDDGVERAGRCARPSDEEYMKELISFC